jgi:uncharacterized membrane protein
MPAHPFFALLGLTAGLLFLLDQAWLGLAAKAFYRKQLGHLTADGIRWPAAALFYLLFSAGLLHFVVLPMAGTGTAGQAAFNGALFGLFAYSTYELTNLATLRKWPVLVTVVDILWGLTLAAVVSTVSWWIAGVIG